MGTLALLLLILAGAAPAAGAPAASDPLDAFERACAAGTPKKRKYDDSTFDAALAKLRATRHDYRPRAWAVTCSYVILCNYNTGADQCPRVPGATVSGTPVNGGELMLLVDYPSRPRDGRGLYAVRAKDVGKKFGFYNGWALPAHDIAVIEGPALDADTVR